MNIYDHLCLADNTKGIELKFDKSKEEKILSPFLDPARESALPIKNKEESLLQIIELQQIEINKLYERISDLEAKLKEMPKTEKKFENSSQEISFESLNQNLKKNNEKKDIDSSKNPIFYSLSPKLLIENSELSNSFNSLHEIHINRQKWEYNEKKLELKRSNYELKFQKKIESDENSKFILFKIEGMIKNISEFKMREMNIKIKGNTCSHFNFYANFFENNYLI